jgi:hypothetical protein
MKFTFDYVFFCWGLDEKTALEFLKQELEGEEPLDRDSRFLYTGKEQRREAKSELIFYLKRTYWSSLYC